MRTTSFLLKSDCCHKEIEMRQRVDYPLGGSQWRMTYQFQACCGCGESCLEVEACDQCGEVGCVGECE